MKVAFWSNVPGKCGVSSNLACIGALGAEQGERAVIVENHLCLHNMEHMLRSPARKSYLREDYCYQRRGLEPLLRQIRCRYPLEHALRTFALSYGDTLFYLPQTMDMNADFFDYEFRQSVEELLNLLEKEGENVLIDTAMEGVTSSRRILELADLVVVNLSQNPYEIEDYIKHYQSVFTKSIFLIGQYDVRSRFHIDLILKKYPFQKSQVAVIPYCTSYADAVREGRVLEYFRWLREAGKRTPEHYFMEKAKQASCMVWDAIHKGGVLV